MRSYNMKRIRQYKGLTQDQIALMTGYDQGIISRLERSLLPPTPRTEKMKKKIAKILEFPKEKIFPEDKEK